jgi:hypothetical protein
MIMPKGRAVLFYPLIMAAYPVVFYYAENTREAITPVEGIVALPGSERLLIGRAFG